MADHEPTKVQHDADWHSRRCLKKSFSKGSLPTSGQFVELVYSTYNLKDEGFNKSAKFGFEVSRQGKSTGLFSFFHDYAHRALGNVWHQCETDTRSPKWSLRLNANEVLTFNPATADDTEVDARPAFDAQPVMSLSQSGCVGAQMDSPGCEFDINGTARFVTRVGSIPLRQVGDDGGDEQENSFAPVPADGRWHNITVALPGCQAFEVVAGVGMRGSGRYALLHAMALNTFNPKGWLFNFLGLKNRIRCWHAYYRSRNDRLALRWCGEQQRYFLQIRSRRDYGIGLQGAPVHISYHITRLWADPRMTQSWDQESRSQ